MNGFTFHDTPVSRNVTAGDYPSEKDAEEAIVRFLESTRAFVIYRQLPGEPIWKHHYQTPKSVRADLFLLPNRRLIEAGWQGGAVVIESKRSGEKIGPGLNQLIDYTNSVFYVEGRIAVVPSFGFLFPVLSQGEAVASIMAQQHIGTAMIERGALRLCCGGSRILSLFETGRIRLGHVDIGRGLGRR